MSPSASPDNRFLAIRAAAQEATDFSMTDADVRRFIELCDQGSDPAAIAEALGRDTAVVDELVRADRAQAVAHRIAIGELPMYPPPEPDQQVVDTRIGSSWVPAAVVILVLVGVIGYAALR